MNIKDFHNCTFFFNDNTFVLSFLFHLIPFFYCRVLDLIIEIIKSKIGLEFFHEHFFISNDHLFYLTLYIGFDGQLLITFDSFRVSHFDKFLWIIRILKLTLWF